MQELLSSLSQSDGRRPQASLGRVSNQVSRAWASALEKEAWIMCYTKLLGQPQLTSGESRVLRELCPSIQLQLSQVRTAKKLTQVVARACTLSVKKTEPGGPPRVQG